MKGIELTIERNSVKTNLKEIFEYYILEVFGNRVVKIIDDTIPNVAFMVDRKLIITILETDKRIGYKITIEDKYKALSAWCKINSNIERIETFITKLGEAKKALDDSKPKPRLKAPLFTPEVVIIYEPDLSKLSLIQRNIFNLVKKNIEDNYSVHMPCVFSTTLQFRNSCFQELLTIEIGNSKDVYVGGVGHFYNIDTDERILSLLSDSPLWNYF